MNHPWRRNLVNRLKAVRFQADLTRQAASLPRWFEPLEPRVLLSGSISGQVFNDANANGTKDAGESNTSGVTIYIDANNDGQLDNGEANTVTDTSGNYSFTGLAAGTYTIAEVLVSNQVVSAPSTGSYSVTLSANQTVTGKNFGDYVGATITGTIFVDQNANGLVDAQEPGIAGATVYFDKNKNGTLDPGEASTTTDATGNYTLAAAPAGSGTLRVNLPAADSTFVSTITAPALTLTPGETLPAANLGFYPPGAITGVVFNDVNANGTKDSTDPGVANATISYTDAGNHTVSTVTDSNGKYGFTGLAAGTYTVTETLPSGLRISTPSTGSISVTLTANQTATGKNFGNYPGASLSGQIFLDPNANGVQDTAETAGVQGATIYFDKNNNNKLDAGEVSTTTDANGNYTLANLPVGNGTVREIVPSGYAPSTVIAVPVPGLTPAENLIGGNIGNYKLAAIIGVVFNDANANGVMDNSGTPPPGVTAYVDTPDAGVTVYLDTNNNGQLDPGEPTSVTDANGIYAFTGLPAATYTIREVQPPNTLVSVPKGGFYTGALPAGTNSNTDNFGNYPVNEIFGQVYNDANKNGAKNTGEAGLKGITVYIDTNNDGQLDNNEVSTITDPSGYYVLTPSFASTFTGTVRAVLPGGMVTSSPAGQGYAVAFNAGSAAIGKDFATYQIVSDSNASVSGTVFNDFNGNGVEDPGETAVSGLSLVLAGNDTSATAVTDSHGNYVFPDVAPGSYTVQQQLGPNAMQSSPPQSASGVPVNVAAGQNATINFGDQAIIGPDLAFKGPPIAAASHGAVPTLLIPGDSVTVTFTVQNVGNHAASGKVNLNIYASAGPIFSSTDEKIFEAANKHISLGVGKTTTYTLSFKIPDNTPPGVYYFSVQVADIAPLTTQEPSADNTATTVGASTVALDFGTFAGHTNAKLVWLTSDGRTLATASLKGGGEGQITDNGDGTYDLNITNATPTTGVTITTDHRSTAPLSLRNIESNLGLTSFTASTTNVLGNVTIPGDVATLKLDGISSGNTFTIGGKLGAFTAAVIAGLELNVATTIGSINAAQWNNGSITADSIGSMTVTGLKATKSTAAVAGNLSADITLSTGVGLQPTLGSLTVAGTLNQSTITSAGNIGTVKLGAMTDSDIYAGVITTEAPGLPDTAADYAADPDEASITSVTVTGLSPATASFVRSRIAAAKVGTIKLAEIDITGPDGSLFGIAGKTIAAVSYVDPTNGLVKLTNPHASSPPDGLFDVVIATP